MSDIFMEFDEQIDKLNDKIDKLTKSVAKLLTINTKIAKTLHLLPVTEKEERDMQILQRKNLAMAAKVNDELNAMENKEELDEYADVFSIDNGNVFNDVIADDFLGGM